MKRLVLIGIAVILLAACNNNDDQDQNSVTKMSTSPVVVVDPLVELSVMATQVLDTPPIDGKLPLDLLPPQ